MFKIIALNSIAKGVFIIKVKTLELNQVSKKFKTSLTDPLQELKIFDQVNYVFQANRSYALIGPSGTGKSSMLAMMAAIDHPTSGSVLFDGAVISNQPMQQRIAMLQNKIGIIFQQPCLIGELTVLENVMLKAIIGQTVTEQAMQHGLQLLDDVGLRDKASSFPHLLSGGQQQKVAILRAIFQAPEFLLADEPTGNLDRASAEQIVSMLLMYQKKYAMGLILSTHDILVSKQCDQVLMIQNQKLM
jgi:putative ABC transport system ATP-binding protein